MKTSKLQLYQISINNQYNYQPSFMKSLLLIALCLVLSQQAVLIASSPSNTAITIPLFQVVAVEPYHSVNPPTTIGATGAQWIYKSGGSAWPDGDTVIFTAPFYADCQSPITLQITADNTFVAKLNGGAPVTGNDWTKIYSFTFSQVKCGVNTLEITTTNKDKGSPAGLIFAVTQEQGKCYSCRSPLSFYNRTSCSCECLQGCNCKQVNPKYAWHGYPTCGCKCASIGKCRENQYWDESSCSCKCKPIACSINQVQDSTTCQCKGKCLPFVPCRSPKIWDFDVCNCVCPQHPFCFNWNESTCRCGGIGDISLQANDGN